MKLKNELLKLPSYPRNFPSHNIPWFVWDLGEHSPQTEKKTLWDRGHSGAQSVSKERLFTVNGPQHIPFVALQQPSNMTTLDTNLWFKVHESIFFFSQVYLCEKPSKSSWQLKLEECEFSIFWSLLIGEKNIKYFCNIHLIVFQKYIFYAKLDDIWSELTHL